MLAKKLLKNTFSSTPRISGSLFKKHLHQGTLKLGSFLNSNSPILANQLSHSGYDFLLVDNQHSPHQAQDTYNMLTQINEGQSNSFVRVKDYKDRAGIQQALDCGATGIMVPYVKTRQEVEEALNVTKFPGTGNSNNRSVYFPLPCANESGLMGYLANSGDEVVNSIQIETKECLDNLDDILRIPELDIAFVGRNDLGLSLGIFEKYQLAEAFQQKEMVEAMNEIVGLCKKHDKIPGTFMFGTGELETHLEQGFKFIALGNENHHVLNSATQFLNESVKQAKSTGHEWRPLKNNLVEIEEQFQLGQGYQDY